MVLNALVNLADQSGDLSIFGAGGLVGGGGEDLQFVEFVPGSEELSEVERKKIDFSRQGAPGTTRLRVDGLGLPILLVIAMRGYAKISADVQRRFTQGGTKNVQSVPSRRGSSNCSAICMPRNWASSR